MLLNMSLNIVVLELYYPILSENMYHIHYTTFQFIVLMQIVRVTICPIVHSGAT